MAIAVNLSKKIGIFSEIVLSGFELHLIKIRTTMRNNVFDHSFGLK